MQEKSKKNKEKWLKLGPLPGILYVEMISEVLDKKKIPHSTSQDGVATAYGFSGTNLAGNRAFIFVPPEYEEETKKVIEQLIDHI